MKIYEKPAEQLFKQFCEGYKTRDLSFVLSLFTKNSTMWGSGLDEYREGREDIEKQLKRDWAQSEKSEIEMVEYIPSSTDASWIAARCNAHITIDGQRHTFEHLRGTLCVQKEDGIWKISHMHCSFPDYRNAEHGSFPVKG